MIVDTIPLSGKKAYLLSDDDEINLGGTAPTMGKTPPLGPGVVWDISSLELQIEGDDLLPLFTRQAEPILSLSIVKEMFPALYQDPFTRRVHTVAGYDDFSQGHLDDFRVMDVNGIPTLVSLGTARSQWLSPRYKFAEAFDLHSVAWELATSKLTPPDGFEYSLTLHGWHEGDDLDSPATSHTPLANQATPLSNRLWQSDNEQTELSAIRAYQLEFTAVVHHDTYLREQHVGAEGVGSLGRPLLRAINLLEKIEPAHDFYSLHELITGAFDYHYFEEENGPLKRLLARLDLSAALSEGESVSLAVHSPAFARVEARLKADVQTRSSAIIRS